MNILINASNIRKSGALQVTLSFLEEVKNITRHNYLIVVSEEVERQINASSFPHNCRVLALSTGTPGSRGFSTQIRKLGEAETSFNAAIVFSVFAPTYWTPKAPHLAGFAYPWAINPDSVFLQQLPFKQKLKARLENSIKKYFIRKNAQYHVVEEDDVKHRLAKYFNIQQKNIYVVNNTYNHHFNNPVNLAAAKVQFPAKRPGEVNLVTLSSNFPHKNLSIITRVSKALKQKGYNNVYFYLTITSNEFDAVFAGDTNIRNLGVVAAAECPAIYAQSDALFLPTMLECFSASYPEAMIMKRPILTSDLSFARSICGNAAIYFDPLNPADIADKIIGLINNNGLYTELVKNGLQRVKQFPSAAGRANAYISICEEIIEQKSMNKTA